jgi:adenylosuccinate lyase
LAAKGHFFHFERGTIPMIKRYTRPEMGEHWSQDNKYKTWLEVELAAALACAECNLIPKEAADRIVKNAKFDSARIDQLEQESKHDVIAFLSCVTEKLGPEGRYLHFGMTSSDVLDTSFALLMVRALDQILMGVSKLGIALKNKAHQHKDTIQIGRSHGIHAEPITFGIKMALYYEELKRNKQRLLAAKKSIAVGKLSGAVGTYAHLPPKVERLVCQKLALKPEPVATQVVQRDRHAEVFCALAVLGGTLEKMAVEIRHLQRTEVREAEENFTRGQKGSSAMPHKRNPIATENITGCSRLLRSYAMAALENIALWHERDISHSSVERVIAPDATILADYMLHRMSQVIEGLVVYPEQMKENLAKSRGLIFSQALLLKLVHSGLSREKAYDLVQRNSMKVWDEGGDLKKWVVEDPEITQQLDPKTIDHIFDMEPYIQSRGEIFNRVFQGEEI